MFNIRVWMSPMDTCLGNCHGSVCFLGSKSEESGLREPAFVSSMC